MQLRGGEAAAGGRTREATTCGRPDPAGPSEVQRSWSAGSASPSASPRCRPSSPEKGRFERLRREAEDALRALARARGPATALFGVPSASRTSSTSTASRPAPAAACRPRCSRGPEAPSVTALQDGRRADPRQDRLHRVRLLRARTDAQPAGTRSTRRADRAAARRRRWRPASARLALGTQTIGSIIRPAAFCGVVGFKPSHDADLDPRRGPARALARPRRLLHARRARRRRLAGGLLCDRLAPRSRLAPAGRCWASRRVRISHRVSEEGLTHFRAACDRLAAPATRSCRSRPGGLRRGRGAAHRVVAAEAAQVHAGLVRALSRTATHPQTAELIRNAAGGHGRGSWRGTSPAATGWATSSTGLMDAARDRSLDLAVGARRRAARARRHRRSGDEPPLDPGRHAGARPAGRPERRRAAAGAPGQPAAGGATTKTCSHWAARDREPLLRRMSDEPSSAAPSVAGSYHDSVVLMQLQRALAGAAGRARRRGGDGDAGQPGAAGGERAAPRRGDGEAGPHDLLIAVKAESEAAAGEALARVDALLQVRRRSGGGAGVPAAQPGRPRSSCCRRRAGC